VQGTPVGDYGPKRVRAQAMVVVLAEVALELRK